MARTRHGTHPTYLACSCKLDKALRRKLASEELQTEQAWWAKRQPSPELKTELVVSAPVNRKPPDEKTKEELLQAAERQES